MLPKDAKRALPGDCGAAKAQGAVAPACACCSNAGPCIHNRLCAGAHVAVHGRIWIRDACAVHPSKPLADTRCRDTSARCIRFTSSAVLTMTERDNERAERSVCIGTESVRSCYVRGCRVTGVLFVHVLDPMGPSATGRTLHWRLRQRADES